MMRERGGKGAKMKIWYVCRGIFTKFIQHNRKKKKGETGKGMRKEDGRKRKEQVVDV